MKKLITIILILAMLLPVSASALVVSDWLYADTWTCTEYLKDGGVMLTTLCLKEDGTAFIVLQVFNADAPGAGRAHVGTWKVTGDNTINVVSGENTSIDLMYLTYNMMYIEKTRRMFFRACMRDGDSFP